MKDLKYLQKMFFLLVMVSVSACSHSKMTSTTTNSHETELKETVIVDCRESVDLGLSVKWATCNVGASSPEEHGDYFAWGETEEKSCYNAETYKWRNGSSKSLIKYCTKDRFGTIDNKTVLDPEDDVAHVKWGGNWRMPTEEEFTELHDKCTWKSTIQNGVKGKLVTGPNGNSIFLPASGYRAEKKLGGRDTHGTYWSATLYWIEGEGVNLFFANGMIGNGICNSFSRDFGLTVRPVTN